MKLRFTIHYQTVWGESLHVILFFPNNTRSYHIAMQTTDGMRWTAETSVVESRQRPPASFAYFYQVEDGEGRAIRREWPTPLRQYAFDPTKTFVFDDLWRDAPLHQHTYTKAYDVTMADSCNAPSQSNVLMQPSVEDSSKQDLRHKHRANEEGHQSQSNPVDGQPPRLPLYRRTLLFRVSAPQVPAHVSIGLCGSHPSLGEWNPARYLLMQPVADHDWILTVDASVMSLPVEYKYVLVDNATRQLISWEEGDNRVAGNRQINDGEVLVCYGEPIRHAGIPWRLSGVSIPLFSLRSEHSFGVGDFGDLQLLSDWASQTGMRVIQLLPLNDTTATHGWSDAHPYNIVSAFALHPHYLSLHLLGSLSDEQKMVAYRRQRRELNALQNSDYLAVDRVKWAYIDDFFNEWKEHRKDEDRLRQFIQQQAVWLRPYVAFCLLRDRYATARTADWNNYAQYTPELVDEVEQQQPDDFLKLCFLQYHLHLQLSQAVAHAHENGVAIMGDLPIGVYRDGVDVWTHPNLFILDEQIGSQPDSDSPYGQNWGFPAYRWDEEETLTWFCSRISHIEHYFDALRLDHVVGYFRSWLIPLHALFAPLGHYEPALPFSEDEIGHYGLVFRRELFTRPFINDEVLEKIFGLHRAYVIDHFLVRQGYNLYALKPEFDTQVKIQHHFHGKTDENSLWIRDGLYRLCQQVLFVEDQQIPGLYHPRHGIYNEHVYQILSTEEKDAFMRLYNNYYHERHSHLWQQTALRRLGSLVSNSRMLIVAEDLGQLPTCVPSVLGQLRILSTEIQSLPKGFGYEFAHLETNPPLSLATTSTHDLPPLRLWWQEHPGRAQRYYATMMQHQGRAPGQLTAILAEEIVARHLFCPSMLCVLPMQDWLATDSVLRSQDPTTERVNAPYDAHNPWNWRMPVALEELLKADRFNQKLLTMNLRSQRFR